MKRMQFITYLVAIFLSFSSLYAALPYLALRSQSVNAARELVGQQMLMNLDSDGFYGVFSITPEYSDSIERGQLAQCLFGPDACTTTNCGKIAITGSLAKASGVINSIGTIVNDNGYSSLNAVCKPASWLADYFGLPRDFKSILTFQPRIQNIILDFNFYLGWKHTYFRVHAPFTYTNWNLNFSEEVLCCGRTGYDPGYFSPDYDTPEHLLVKASDFFTARKTPSLSESPDGTPIIFHPLAYSKFPTCNCNQIDTARMSDIEMALGWNILAEQDYHLGFEVRASMPTGTKPCATYLFYPMVGDGGFWKAGGGMSAHTIFWRSDTDNVSVGFWVEANVQHLFSTCQDRVFDLCGKPNSRYMLAEKMGPNSETNPLVGNPVVVTEDSGFTLSKYQFAQEYVPVANLTRRYVDISIPVEADVVAKLAWTYKNLQLDVGYEFWGRSCEQICTNKRRYASGLDGKTWALKGDAYVYGFEYLAPGETEEEIAQWVPLAATECRATIHSGTNFVPGASLLSDDPTAAWYNPKVDNAQIAYIYDEAYSANIPVFKDTDEGTLEQRTSIQSIMLSKDLVDYNGAATKSMSNKLFAHISHTWHDSESYSPFFGAGASIEFGAYKCAKDSHCPNTCNACNTCCEANNCCCNTAIGCASTNRTCNSCCSSSGTTNNCLSCCCDSNACCTNGSCAYQCCNTCNDDCCKKCALSQWAIWVKAGIGF